MRTHRRRRHPDWLDLIAWNCYVANADANVVDALCGWADDHAPDVFALSEAATHADALHEFCRRRPYRLLQDTPPRHRKRPGGPVDDTADSAILLAEDVELVRHRTARMSRRWLVFSHRRWHTPREYEVAVIRVRRRKWRVCAAHPPTHGLHGGNAGAFRESLTKARGWLLARSRVPSVYVGDLNERRHELAQWLGRRFRVFGSGIDLAATTRAVAGRWWALGKGGGDHHGRRYRFTA